MGNHKHSLIVRLNHTTLQISHRSKEKSRGLVEADNSGSANIFSICELALYSYSPTSDYIAKNGLGGSQGILLIAKILVMLSFCILTLVLLKGGIDIKGNLLDEIN